jgi:hypothetical protein
VKADKVLLLHQRLLKLYQVPTSILLVSLPIQHLEGSLRLRQRAWPSPSLKVAGHQLLLKVPVKQLHQVLVPEHQVRALPKPSQPGEEALLPSRLSMPWQLEEEPALLKAGQLLNLGHLVYPNQYVTTQEWPPVL